MTRYGGLKRALLRVRGCCGSISSGIWTRPISLLSFKGGSYRGYRGAIRAGRFHGLTRLASDSKEAMAMFTIYLILHSE